MHISNILYHMVKMQEHHWMLLEQHDKDKTSNKREFSTPCSDLDGANTNQHTPLNGRI